VIKAEQKDRYNYGKYITRCIRSCREQFNHIPEIIVVDDNSDDDSLEKMTPFIKDITLIKSSTNIGVAAAANLGIQAAKGQFVVRVDADDFINQNLAFFMRTYLVANLDAFCVSCDYHLVDEYGEETERRYSEVNPIACGIMYRRDLLWELGGYNSDMRHREEEELRKRLGVKYNIHHLKIPFYRYRMHNSNKTKLDEYKSWKID